MKINSSTDSTIGTEWLTDQVASLNSILREACIEFAQATITNQQNVINLGRNNDLKQKEVQQPQDLPAPEAAALLDTDLVGRTKKGGSGDKQTREAMLVDGTLLLRPALSAATSVLTNPSGIPSESPNTASSPPLHLEYGTSLRITEIGKASKTNSDEPSIPALPSTSATLTKANIDEGNLKPSQAKASVDGVVQTEQSTEATSQKPQINDLMESLAQIRNTIQNQPRKGRNQSRLGEIYSKSIRPTTSSQTLTDNASKPSSSSNILLESATAASIGTNPPSSTLLFPLLSSAPSTASFPTLTKKPFLDNSRMTGSGGGGNSGGVTKPFTPTLVVIQSTETAEKATIKHSSPSDSPAPGPLSVKLARKKAAPAIPLISSTGNDQPTAAFANSNTTDLMKVPVSENLKMKDSGYSTSTQVDTSMQSIKEEDEEEADIISNLATNRDLDPLVEAGRSVVTSTAEKGDNHQSLSEMVAELKNERSASYNMECDEESEDLLLAAQTAEPYKTVDIDLGVPVPSAAKDEDILTTSPPRHIASTETALHISQIPGVKPVSSAIIAQNNKEVSRAKPLVASLKIAEAAAKKAREDEQRRAKKRDITKQAIERKREGLGLAAGSTVVTIPNQPKSSSVPPSTSNSMKRPIPKGEKEEPATKKKALIVKPSPAIPKPKLPIHISDSSPEKFMSGSSKNLILTELLQKETSKLPFGTVEEPSSLIDPITGDILGLNEGNSSSSSDNRSESSSSGDEQEEDNNTTIAPSNFNRKGNMVASWATPNNLGLALKKQKEMDVDDIFPQFERPNFNEMMGNPKFSVGHKERMTLTLDEKEAYKKAIRKL